MAWMAAAISAASDVGKMAFSARQAAIQRDFQDRMAGQMYQYRARDMEAAGLNPILAATQGAGSPPSGAMGSAAGTGDFGVSSGLQADIQGEQKKILRYQAGEAQAKAAKADVDYNDAQHGLVAREMTGYYGAQAQSETASANQVTRDMQYWEKNPFLRQLYLNNSGGGIPGTLISGAKTLFGMTSKDSGPTKYAPQDSSPVPTANIRGNKYLIDPATGEVKDYYGKPGSSAYRNQLMHNSRGATGSY